MIKQQNKQNQRVKYNFYIDQSVTSPFTVTFSFPPFLKSINAGMPVLNGSVIQFHLQMSFASNNSRNIANLLRYDALQPISQQKRVLPSVNPPILQPPPPNSRERQQIPVEQAFTPQQRITRKRTPLNGNMRTSNRQDDNQVESIRVRLDQIVRYYDERHSNLQNKMMIRLNQLENFIMKEVPKIDNSNMINTDIIALKETINDIRKQQQYQSNELNAMKSLNSDRNSADALQQLGKQKQKSTVLFMQIVRLGDTVQKMTQYMNSLGRNYQAKYQDMQNKLSTSQKNLMIMSQKTSSGSEVLNQLGDKLISRLATTESNLLLLGKEQIKDKQAISRLMNQNDRMGQDLQLLLRNMQADFQSKLENRVQETVNRLMMEHEERIRSYEEIKKNLDLRDRISNQKQMSEKMETKAKYDTMDSLVRNQLLKKQQSIRSLHKAVQDQFRNVMNQIQIQSSKRKQQQAAYRSEIKRLQQNVRKQYDLYKNHQDDLVDKFTDMIKTQIQIRLSAQLDLKKLTSNIAHEIVNDINNLKEALSTSSKKLAASIREASTESADRVGQLSYYIDSEIKKVVEVVTEKYSKMKSVFTKLAQQLRDHLQNTEQNRKSVETRLTAIQEDFQKLKGEVNNQIDDFYSDLQARLKEQKQFVETVVFKKNNDLTVRVSKLQEYTNQYFQLLKAGIEDNKDLLNKKLTHLGDSSSGTNEEQMKSMRNVIFQIKKITEQIKSQNEQQFRELRKDIRDSEGKNKDEVFALETKINQRIAKNTQKEKQLEEQMNELAVKINNIRAQTNSPNNSISQNKIKKISDDMGDINQRVSDNEKLVEKTMNQITVLRAEIDNISKKL